MSSSKRNQRLSRIRDCGCPARWACIGAAFALAFASPVQAHAIQITNVTRGVVIFHEDFESGAVGAAPRAADPAVGHWRYNGQALAVIGDRNSEPFPAMQGSNLLRIARREWPELTAVGDPVAGGDARAGDRMRIQFAVRVERGVASVYPVATDHDIAQVSFFGDGRVSVVDPSGITHQFLTQTLAPAAWNVVTMEFLNGSAEWEVSVNGATPEQRTAGSSVDRRSGGRLLGLRLQTDAPETVAYFDLIPGLALPPPALTLTRLGDKLELDSAVPGYALEENAALSEPGGWWAWPGGEHLPVSVAIQDAGVFFRLRKVAPPPATLPKLLGITWRKGPNLPQGFQDSDGGIVAGHLITVGGYCAGQTNVPGKATQYPPGFLRRVWALDLNHPDQGWWSLPQFPGAERQELFGIVVADRLYCWGGFSYAAPYCYRDGYRLSRPSGAWRWDTLPSLPWPLCSAGICAMGSKIYVVGGGDYDWNRFYTNADRNQGTPRLGARLLVLDTERLDAGWKELPACPGTPRFVAAVAAIHGRLYLIGGASGEDNRAGRYCTVVDNWCYDPATPEWRRLQDTPIATGNFPAGAVVFRDRYLVLVGGYQYGNVLNPDGTVRAPYGAVSKYYPENPYNSDVLVYDAQTGAFGTADPLPLCNNLPMAVVAGDTLHLIGGETGGSIVEGEPFGHHPDLYLTGQLRVWP